MRKALDTLDPDRGSHPGLLLQRYLAYEPDDKQRPIARRKLLDGACRSASSPSLKSVYAQAYSRWQASFPAGKSHHSKHLATALRMIVGLGAENVLEAGLRLHHTYGIPIIPGSALKGLASHYCHDIWGQAHDEAAAEENLNFRRREVHHSLLFGEIDDAGIIAFHDAWLVPESLGSALRLDVMTPHHPQWQLEKAAPTDLDSPKPVSFLSVAGTFDIHLSWCGPVGAPDEQKDAWTVLAMQLLTEALAEWGIGGKTSSGYGRLVPPGSANIAAARTSDPMPLEATRPKPGEAVEARLLEERTKKGGWMALHMSSGLRGPIQNSDAVPASSKAGDIVRLIVASANAFKYPTPEEEERSRRVPAAGRGPSRTGGRPR